MLRKGIERCIKKCNDNKARIVRLRDRLIEVRAEKEGDAQVKAVLDSIEAERAAEQERKDKLQEEKYRAKGLEEGNKQYEQLSSAHKAPIDAWKGLRSTGSGPSSKKHEDALSSVQQEQRQNWRSFRSGGSVSNSEPSAAGGTTSATKGKLTLRKKVKDEP